MISRELVGFLIHQVTATLGVVVLSAMSWYGTVELLRLGRANVTSETTASVLLGTPGFPFQAASGLALGLTLARRLPAKAAAFVWILPFMWFGFGALAVAHTSKLTYLVGGSCNPNRGCFYQLSFTLPLIASVAYSVGAAVSRWWRKRSPKSAAEHSHG
jgi:hypothetical protein